MLPDLLTAQQVADIFQVKASTVRHWARTDVLPVIRVKGMKSPRFRRADIERLLESEQSA